MRALDAVSARRGRSATIISDNGTELRPRRAGRDQAHRRCVARHRARQADAARLRRELPTAASGTSASTRKCSRRSRRDPHRHQAVVAGRQPSAPALSPRRPDAPDDSTMVGGRPAAQSRSAPPVGRCHRGCRECSINNSGHSLSVKYHGITGQLLFRINRANERITYWRRPPKGDGGQDFFWDSNLINISICYLRFTNCRKRFCKFILNGTSFY